MGRLTVVATPIGNLGDLTSRAVEALASADLVLAEDTRRTRTLLTHLEIKNKELERLDAHAEAKSLDTVLARLEAGATIVLVSDAGTPAISDPGARLVQRAAAAGHEVSSLPGASAVTTAIAASGFGGSRFRFLGFLPRKGSALVAAIEEIAETPEIVVYFESAARMAASLQLVAERLGARDAVVAREMTKKHEELIRGPLDELARGERDRAWRGEITVVIGPRPATPVARLSPDELDRRIEEETRSQDRPRTIAKRLSADTGWSSREIYQRIVAMKEGSE